LEGSECKEKAILIANTVRAIQRSKLKCLTDIPDLFIRKLYKQRLLQSYCKRAFADFIENVSAKLAEHGYGRLQEEEPIARKREDKRWNRNKSRLSKSR
jgi:hypothetical protein